MLKQVSRMFARLLAVLAVFVAAAGAQRTAVSTPIPTPSDVLKIKVGADGVLASYDQIVSYFRTIDPLTDRITVEDPPPHEFSSPRTSIPGIQT